MESAAVAAWEANGTYVKAGRHELFVADLAARANADGPPILVLHGFPTCSFDWRAVAARLASDRRVVIPDMLGYGLSPKPDQAYSLFEQADLVSDVARTLGLDQVDLVSHDMGDSVAGELLARSLDGDLPFEVRRRVLTNGSIYTDLMQLTAGQQLLLELPDERLPDNPNDGSAFKSGLAGTFPPGEPPSDDELDAQWLLTYRERGDLLLPRLIRYVEERYEHQPRWTGALETHPAPLRVVWGELDPVAVVSMVERLAAARPDADVIRLKDVAHWPMIEVPDVLGARIAEWFR